MVLSTVVPTSFVGVDSVDKMRFRFITGNLSRLLWETETGGWGDISPFHLIAQHLFGIMVLSTGVPTSFMGGDSFDETAFRFIAGRPSLLLWKTESGGNGDVLPFHLIAQH